MYRPDVELSANDGAWRVKDAPLQALESNRRQVLEAIERCRSEGGNVASETRLVAVSKKHPASMIDAMASLGQRDFGENYLQEAIEKMTSLRDVTSNGEPLRWHFIGHIQSRKCREIAPAFDWVHTVESLKVARKLDQHRGEAGMPPLNVLIQVNIDDESSKSGVAPGEILDLAGEMQGFEHLSLRGLMIIPRSESDTAKQRGVFARCRGLLDQLRAATDAPLRARLNQLSMGMTGDMAAAIGEGATMVRIGTALFGERPTK